MKYLICPTCGKVLGDIEIDYEIKSEKIMTDSTLSEQEKIVKRKANYCTDQKKKIVFSYIFGSS